MGLALVLVPGHGICKHPGASELDESWLGTRAGEAGLLLEHLRVAVELAAERSAVLVFSGGQTQPAAPGLSEGQSYLELAHAAGWWGHSTLAEQALVEGFARDSLENLAFGLARFRMQYASKPSELIVCGWRFKTERFGLHRRALGWKGAYTYVGVNDPPLGPALDAARRGEAKKCSALLLDPLLQGAAWQSQRKQRDPFESGEPYSAQFGSMCQRAMD